MASQDAIDREALVQYLRSQRMNVVPASRWEQVRYHLAKGAIDLAVVDLLLGNWDRVSLLREIRSLSAVPLVATAKRFDEIDRVIGFELGADECLARPFGKRELLARICAILRPVEYSLSASRSKSTPVVFQFGGWRFDSGTRHLTSPTGADVVLTGTECRLLEAFLNEPMKVRTRLHLIHACRLREDILDRSVSIWVLRLRRKLMIDPRGPEIIRAVRGCGYMFALPVERSQPVS